jgi:penicillin-binding protein 1A
MAIAYATIANEGKRVTPTTIDKVVQNEGQEDEKVLEAAPREEGEQVINPEVARKATEVMVGDITHGIAYKASLNDRPAAGKTGTSENFFDSWFVGFTPQLVTGIWMGYQEGGQTLDGLLNIGGRQLGRLAPPTIIWQNYMQKVLQDKPVKKFEATSTNIPQSPVPVNSTGTTPTAMPGSSPGPPLNQPGELVPVF